MAPQRGCSCVHCSRNADACARTQCMRAVARGPHGPARGRPRGGAHQPQGQAAVAVAACAHARPGLHACAARRWLARVHDCLCTCVVMHVRIDAFACVRACRAGTCPCALAAAHHCLLPRAGPACVPQVKVKGSSDTQAKWVSDLKQLSGACAHVGPGIHVLASAVPLAPHSELIMGAAPPVLGTPPPCACPWQWIHPHALRAHRAARTRRRRALLHHRGVPAGAGAVVRVAVPVPGRV